MTSAAPSLPPPAVRAVRRAPASSMVLLAAIGLGHVMLAFVMRAVPAVATAHALATVVVGVWIAARRPVAWTACAVAYITGCEVLWRMTHAGVFWEYGKYASSVVLLVAITRIKVRRNLGLALGYLALLLPSAVLTVLALDAEQARQQISFNLSGPLSLTLCIILFSNVRLTMPQVLRTLFSLIAPVLGIAAISYYSTISVQDLQFTGQSNTVTSGGFGPNQVSAMLGLGLLSSVIILLQRRQPWRIKGPLLVIAVAFAAQAALTFSRGGLVMAGLSSAAAMFYLVRERRTRITLVLLASMLFVVGKYVVVPRLVVFTQGKLAERYTSTSTSNRSSLAEADIGIFFDNIALGVGPGVASSQRSDLGFNVAAHTEFTRMLADHGILGALSMVLLGLLGVRTLRRTETLMARALVVAMLCWFTLFLLINAMRIVAPSFLFGLACAIAESSRALPRQQAPP